MRRIHLDLSSNKEQYLLEKENLLRLVVGSLVESQTHFKGIGKILSISVENKTAKVGFFTSPNNPYDEIIEIEGSDLRGKQSLFEKTVIFCKFGANQNWRMGFYDGERPNNKHLIYFDKSESDIFDIEDLFVPNTLNRKYFSALDFLSSRATTSVKHYLNRTEFIKAYIEQRRSCRSISSIPSSAVNLEVHQLSVVMQVLNDPEQKYLLGDEVGLGKTIEAGFLIREHILEKKDASAVLVIAPDSLVEQWGVELSTKFHLEDVMEDALDEEEQKLLITPFSKISALPDYFQTPTMVVIDEGHNLAKYAWASDSNIYEQISKLCQMSSTTLILSGTPIAGNAKPFLAMLHCLSPENYHLTPKGIEEFDFKVESRQKLAGIYEALSIETDDFTLEGIITDIEDLVLDDGYLIELLEKLKPEIDFFNEEKDNDLRNSLVVKIKRHFGEKYRLFQRFIRNRRGAKNSNIEQLFPGLGKIDIVEWEVKKDTPSLDKQLDDFRGVVIDENEHLDNQFILELLDSLLDSPASLANKLQSFKNTKEFQRFIEIIDFALDCVGNEQLSKDNSTKHYIEEWLQENPNGKITVFCGDSYTADNFFQTLNQSRSDVERHNPVSTPKFVENDEIKILVLDERGEDGLNLQGPRRLAIHYSLPRSLVRIEQRIGRLNRYSATDIGIKPIENMILVPSQEGFISRWASLLKNTIRVFSETTASIQLVLEDVLKKEEPSLLLNGFQQLEKIENMLGGDGIIAKEKKKVADQEVWQEMKYGIAEIKEFSSNLQASDSAAEENHHQIQKWIKESLKFGAKKTEDATFVYQYVLGRTRLNIDEFLKHCILGMDFNSGLRNPSTKPMTPDRQTTSKTGAYPLRFGQPFLDTIFNFTLATPMGLSSAVIRKINIKFGEPKTFVKLNWLCSLESTFSVEQRNLDSIFGPTIKSEWIDSRGNVVENTALLNLLEKPIKLSPKGTDNSYQDFEILVSSQQDVWTLVDQFIDANEWMELIEKNIGDREAEVIEELITENQNKDYLSKLSVVLVSAISVTLIGE